MITAEMHPVKNSITSKAKALLKPPLAFTNVSIGIYRSAYPTPPTYPLIEKYGIRTFICLTPGDLRNDLIEHAEMKNIAITQCDVRSNQEPFLSMDEAMVAKTVSAAMESANQPVLIFCQNGKLKTSCVVGCIRKKQVWSMAAIIEEFEMFAEGEGGLCDLAFIDRCQLDDEVNSDLKC